MWLNESGSSASAPPWLEDQRVEARRRLVDAVPPSVEEEVWRYSLIDELDLDAYHPVDAATAHRKAVPVDPLSERVEGWAARVDCIDGVPVLVRCSDAATAAGLHVALASQFAEAVPLGDHVDVFGDANLTNGVDPVVITVKPGAVVPGGILVRHWFATEAGVSFPRLVVRVGPDADVSVVESFASIDGDLLVVPATHLWVGSAARLAYTNLGQLGAAAWQLGTVAVEVDQQGTFTGALAAFGGRYTRLRSDCRLVGRGATAILLAAYFGDGHQVVDHRTFQEHLGPDTTSELLFKGATDDYARSVYSGLIRVAKTARGTNAFQTNRNVKLSEHAWAESVPNLEIENNDVRCSHASTVGPVDADQRFYLESRGVPTPAAERLIVAGFFEEVIRRQPEAAVADLLRRIVAAKLDPKEDR